MFLSLKMAGNSFVFLLQLNVYFCCKVIVFVEGMIKSILKSQKALIINYL